MKHLPTLLALMLIFASCATLRKEHNENNASYRDTIHVTVTDTTHIKVIHETDSASSASTHQRDSIIIKEVITNHYDPTTGNMIEQVIDKLTSQVTDLSEYRETILHQQQLIDSLLTANMSLSSSHQKDSTYTSDIKEKGDAARSGWQSTLNSGKYIFLFGLLALLVVIILQHYRKK